MAKSPAAILYDQYGDPINSGNPLHSKAQGLVANGVAPSGNPLLVGGWDGEYTRTIRTLNDGTLRVFPAADSLKHLRTGRVKNGTNENMNVNGSVTPVNFTFNADPTVDLLLRELRFVFVPNVLRVTGASFGAFAALTNGVRIAITDSGEEHVIALLKISEDMFAYSTVGNLILEVSLTSNDLVVFGMSFGESFKLVAGSGDKVEVRIQDNLTSAGHNYLYHFSGTVYAVEDVE